MAINFHGAEVIVEMGFGYKPLIEPSVWTAVTSDVRALSCHRGRQYELDRMEAGKASWLFNNRGGDYNPKNTAGAYTPDVKPGLQIRFSCIYNTVTYRLWQGAIDRLPLSFPGSQDSVVKITATDVMKILALKKVTFGFSNVVLDKTPRGFWRMTDTSDDSAEGDHTLTLTGSPDTAEAGVWTGDKAMQFDGSTQYATIADGASDLNFTGDLTIVAWVNVDSVAAGARHSIIGRRNAAGDVAYRLEVNDTRISLFQGPFGGFGQSSASGISVDTWHFVAVTRTSAGTKSFYIDGVPAGTSVAATAPLTVSDDSQLATDNSASTLMLDGHISEVAIWDSVLTAADISDMYDKQSEELVSQRTDQRIKAILDEIGFSNYDLETGQTTMAATTATVDAKAVDEINKALDTESSYLFVGGDGRIKFHDRHYRSLSQGTVTATFGPSDLPYQDPVISTDDTVIWNDVRVTPGDPDTTAAFVVSDSDSDDWYGPRTFEKTTYPLNQNEGFDLAHHLLNRYKEPAQRIHQIKIRLGKDPALWPIVLGAEIGDRYTIKKTLEGDDLDQDVYLEAITHQITQGKKWTVTWQLSPADPEDTWILEDEVLGLLDTTTILSY